MEDIRRLKGGCDGRWLSGNELARTAIETAFQQTECVFSNDTMPLRELHAFVSCKTLPCRVVPKFHIRKVRIVVDAFHWFYYRSRDLRLQKSLNVLSMIGDPSAFDRGKPTPLSVTFAFNTQIDYACHSNSYVNLVDLLDFIQDVHNTLERLHLRENTTVLFEYLDIERYQQEPTITSWAALRKLNWKQLLHAFKYAEIVARAEWPDWVDWA